MIPKQLPHHPPSEKAVLGGCLLDDRAVTAACSLLVETDFYLEPHRLLFRAIRDIAKSGAPVDWVTVSARLKGKGAWRYENPAAFLCELADAIPSAANVRHYIGTVKKQAQLRKLYRSALKIAEAALEDRADADAVGRKFQEEAFSYASGFHKAGRMKHISEIIPAAVEEMEESKGWGIRSGIKDLDDITRGFFPGDFIFIAGRPSMGKTALALDIILDAALKGESVATHNLEMSELDLVKRILAKKARVGVQKARTGNLNQEEWARITAATGDLEDPLIYISDETKVTVSRVRSCVQEMTTRYGHPPGLLVIDYLTLMDHEGPSESQNVAVAKLSRGLKLLGKSLNIPIIVLAQLNRKVEERPNKRPMLSDLRDSGSIEQDADVIIFLFREEMYAQKDSTGALINGNLKGKAEIIVAKQRNGPTGTAYVSWIANTATFRDAVPEGVTENYQETL